MVDTICLGRLLRASFFHTLEIKLYVSHLELYGQLMNDGYLFFWQSVAMLNASGERLPGSEQGR